MMAYGIDKQQDGMWDENLKFRPRKECVSGRREKARKQRGDKMKMRSKVSPEEQWNVMDNTLE